MGRGGEKRQSPIWPAYLIVTIFLLLLPAIYYGSRIDSLAAAHTYLIDHEHWQTANCLSLVALRLHPNHPTAKAMDWKSRFILRYMEAQKHRDSEITVILD